ncbi:hypothetical protein PHLGIDRAFT_319266 [Phlebiopsis gigantea 11061_1 CR5-6]|uniref:DUF6534 domain-containing protein n=1 Tax=Phlebiopsis gigantea (strain 11061_1 CR5-6) TaxID=745531 RepID=A0A0C3RQC1_PHLG1|nr:hypothetical protein PHLGIDRAFT_319266 [Phlebiopsis gigantea 11061_1 CR5-6]
MTYAINTSLLTSVFAVATFITCLAMPDNFIFLALIFPLSELYSNSLLASLNMRGRLRRRIVRGSVELDDLEALSRGTVEFAHEGRDRSPHSQSPRPRARGSPRSDMPKPPV